MLRSSPPLHELQRPDDTIFTAISTHSNSPKEGKQAEKKEWNGTEATGTKRRQEVPPEHQVQPAHCEGDGALAQVAWRSGGDIQTPSGYDPGQLAIGGLA